MPRSSSLSAAQARRLALAAQGFAAPRPAGRVDRGHVRRVVDRVGLVQIDSVNVLVRSHYLPLFSRLGPYRRALLDEAAYRHADLFEYWGHEQSLLPVDAHPLLRWRMEAAARGEIWGGLARLARERPEFVEAVLAEVAERGPLSASDLKDGGGRRGPWWGWGDGKRALEWLHWTGRLAAGRRSTFERTYDVPERVLPAAVLAAPTPPEAEARKELLRRAARALGVATAADLADYHRQRGPAVRPLVAELVEAGDLVPVAVEGWRHPAYVAAGHDRVPRRVGARALLSPFDSLVWYRERAQRLFAFHLRLEIYTPAARRVWGYYVLPFLLGDELVARVDLKAERKASTLAVLGVFAEGGLDPVAVAEPLAAELAAMASWLGLERVEVAGGGGDLAPALRRVVGTMQPAW